MNKNLLALSVAAASALALSASAAVSSNIVGYVKVPLKRGLNLISNPLNNTNPNGNKISTMFAGKTCSVLRWGNSGFVSTDVFNGVVIGTDSDILPGEGFFVDVGADTEVTLVGEALVGTQTVNVDPGTTGNAFVASKIPLAGTATFLGLAPANSISALVWNNASGSFTAFDYFGGVGWIGAEPSLAVAQGVLIQSTVAFPWTKTFNP
ncbi:MAG TPA: hypothetical protein PLX89_03305 [Verrucomicrobiota bacterium]|nr:hypothetical protein [Verrucomicrobiota bacterium]